MASQPVVSNTSPLITLAGVGMLALLPAVYGEIRIAKAVCDEYEAKRGALEPALDTLAWLVVEAIEPDRELVAIQGLGRGEAATIALGSSYSPIDESKRLSYDEAGVQASCVYRYGVPWALI